MGVFRSISRDDSPIRELSEKEREIQMKIAQLEHLVKTAPELERKAREEEERAREEKQRTLPPPSEVIVAKRENEFLDKLSRGALKNERRAVAKNGLLLLLLIGALCALAAWIYQAIQV